ncbi:hypothetical protein CYMTET_35185, partial [Cymbomonas tetramitiformis]
SGSYGTPSLAGVAQRVGQSREVMIYRMVTRCSVEERMMQQSKKKMVLEHLVVQKMTQKELVNQEELDDLLKYGAEELFRESNPDAVVGNGAAPSGAPRAIYYDDTAVDVLLDRSQVTKDNEKEEEEEEDAFAAFKVANFELREEGISSSDQEADAAEQEEEKYEQQAVLGKGKRIKNKVNYFQDEHTNLDDYDLSASGHLSRKAGPSRASGGGAARPAEPPPLMSGEGKALRVLGFSHKERSIFLKLIMRYGMGNFVFTEFSAELKRKSLSELKSYAATFLSHINEDPTDLPHFSDGVPKEGINPVEVLKRIAVLHLFQRKVKSLALPLPPPSSDARAEGQGAEAVNVESEDGKGMKVEDGDAMQGEVKAGETKTGDGREAEAVKVEDGEAEAVKVEDGEAEAVKVEDGEGANNKVEGDESQACIAESGEGDTMKARSWGGEAGKTEGGQDEAGRGEADKSEGTLGAATQVESTLGEFGGVERDCGEARMFEGSSGEFGKAEGTSVEASKAVSSADRVSNSVAVVNAESGGVVDGRRRWSSECDIMLMRGLLKHGYGRWLEILQDPINRMLQEAIRVELNLPGGTTLSEEAQAELPGLDTAQLESTEVELKNGKPEQDADMEPEPLELAAADSENVDMEPEPLELAAADSEKADMEPEPLEVAAADSEKADMEPEPLELAAADSEKADMEPEPLELAAADSEKADMEPEPLELAAADSEKAGMEPEPLELAAADSEKADMEPEPLELAAADSEKAAAQQTTGSDADANAAERPSVKGAAREESTTQEMMDSEDGDRENVEGNLALGARSCDDPEAVKELDVREDVAMVTEGDPTELAEAMDPESARTEIARQVETERAEFRRMTVFVRTRVVALTDLLHNEFRIQRGLAPELGRPPPASMRFPPIPAPSLDPLQAIEFKEADIPRPAGAPALPVRLPEVLDSTLGQPMGDTAHTAAAEGSSGQLEKLASHDPRALSGLATRPDLLMQQHKQQQDEGEKYELMVQVARQYNNLSKLARAARLDAAAAYTADPQAGAEAAGLRFRRAMSDIFTQCTAMRQTLRIPRNRHVTTRSGNSKEDQIYMVASTDPATDGPGHHLQALAEWLAPGGDEEDALDTMEDDMEMEDDDEELEQEGNGEALRGVLPASDGSHPAKGACSGMAPKEAPEGVEVAPAATRSSDSAPMLSSLVAAGDGEAVAVITLDEDSDTRASDVAPAKSMRTSNEMRLLELSAEDTRSAVQSGMRQEADEVAAIGTGTAVGIHEVIMIDLD